MEARVVKILSKDYTVSIGGTEYHATPRGSIRRFGKILVGDIVDVSPNEYGNGYVIEKVHTRINQLDRPPIANLEQLVIVVAMQPSPDFELVDKLLIFASQRGIKPIIVVNKCDITDNENIMRIFSAYKYCTDSIIAVSAISHENLAVLRKLLKGHLSAFAGQSAVGKSTLINALTDSNVAPTQGLSAKTERGKHTTRHTQIYTIDGDILIADTAGFSMLELKDIKHTDLCNFYPEFASSDPCAYSGCTHINCPAKDCAVVSDVNDGLIDKGRYERYVKLYGELKEIWRNKYD